MSADQTQGVVLAVCAAHAPVHLDRIGDSGIAKSPITGPVTVTADGVDGDLICDTKHHGGVDQAVYAYSETEARRWAEDLGRDLPAGWFGENLRIEGIEVTDAIVGERWRIGDTVELECTIPRTPCRTFAQWAEETRWVARFAERADTGAYLRVVVGGDIAAGDPVTVLSRPTHGVRVRELFAGGADIDGLTHLQSDPRYTGKVAREAGRMLRKHARAAVRQGSGA